MKNNYIEINVQKRFRPGMTDTYEHTAHLPSAYYPTSKKETAIITSNTFSFKNAFGEVHHNFIPVVLDYHHVPQELIECIMSLYEDFATVVADSYTTSFVRIDSGVLQGDCSSPVIFNLLINTFIQYIRQGRFPELGYSLSSLLRPIHWFQFADDAAIATGREYETQVLLNAFTAWCTWSSMIIRVDKSHTFDIAKNETPSVQTHPKQFVNNEQIPALKNNKSFKYLGTYSTFKWTMKNIEKSC